VKKKKTEVLDALYRFESRGCTPLLLASWGL